MQTFWRLPFAPGMLKAVSRKDGRRVLTEEVRTAEALAKIVRAPDLRTVKTDGMDLSFVTAKVVDKNGTLVPAADNLIKFHVTGASASVILDAR